MESFFFIIFSRAEDSLTQPLMMSFKAFLAAHDDSTSDEEAVYKYQLSPSTSWNYGASSVGESWAETSSSSPDCGTANSASSGIHSYEPPPMEESEARSLRLRRLPSRPSIQPSNVLSCREYQPTEMKYFTGAESWNPPGIRSGDE